MISSVLPCVDVLGKLVAGLFYSVRDDNSFEESSSNLWGKSFLFKYERKPVGRTEEESTPVVCLSLHLDIQPPSLLIFTGPEDRRTDRETSGYYRHAVFEHDWDYIDDNLKQRLGSCWQSLRKVVSCGLADICPRQWAGGQVSLMFRAVQHTQD